MLIKCRTIAAALLLCLAVAGSHLHATLFDKDGKPLAMDQGAASGFGQDMAAGAALQGGDPTSLTLKAEDPCGFEAYPQDSSRPSAAHAPVLSGQAPAIGSTGRTGPPPANT